ncbi:MAG TPA: hypothetical protein VHQ45_04935 [Gemmatimonadaceae bacterium]|nr:hypothetical protein [Gemmatimonadaceae bacterium]
MERHEAEGVVRRALGEPDGGADVTGTFIRTLDGGALGAVPTSDRHAPFPLAHHAPGGNVLLVSGTPVHLEQSLPQLLARAAEADGTAAARLLTTLDGPFAAVHWDAAAGALTVVTDFLGFQPLYVAGTPGGVVLASDLRSIARSGAVTLTPDPAAWGAFFAFGHLIDDLSYFREVRRVPAGSVLRFERDGRRTTERYWHWPAPAPELQLANVDTGEIVETLVRSARAYGAYGQTGVLLLSGGFDSRLVLHVLRRAGVDPRALIVRQRDQNGDADGRFAVRTAQDAGVPFEVASPGADFYDSPAYQRYLERSELANPSLGLFIARVSEFIRPDMGAVWDGLAPQAMRRLGPHARRMDEYLRGPIRRVRALADEGAHHVFTAEWAAEMREGFEAAVATEAARYGDDEYAVAQFAVRNRTRLRIGNNPFQVYGRDVLPFTPGVTREYYGRVGRLSGATKGSDDLVRRLLETHFPATLRVPFCSGPGIVTYTSSPGLAYRSAQLRRWIRRTNRPRRLFERLGVFQDASYDVTRTLASTLADVTDDGGRVRPEVVAMARDVPAARLTLGDQGLQQLFYWTVMQRLVAGAPTPAEVPA